MKKSIINNYKCNECFNNNLKHPKNLFRFKSNSIDEIAESYLENDFLKWYKDHVKNKKNFEKWELFTNLLYEKENYPLIYLEGKKHGFDGIYVDDNFNIFFLEAKNQDKTFKKLIKESEKTINKCNPNRTHELKNSINILKNTENSKGVYFPFIINKKRVEISKEQKLNIKKSLEILDNTLKNLAENISLNIPNNIMVHSLCNYNKKEECPKNDINYLEILFASINNEK
ncbi:MAG: hypothetical protein ACRDBR_01535 [Metamycoplasmataceae bacterium]